jgi:hypothetical protein
VPVGDDGAVRLSTVRLSTVRLSTVRLSTVRLSTGRLSTVRPGPAWLCALDQLGHHGYLPEQANE